MISILFAFRFLESIILKNFQIFGIKIYKCYGQFFELRDFNQIFILPTL